MSTKPKNLGAPAFRRHRSRPTCRKATLQDLVEAAHNAGARVKISLAPKTETTEEKNQRIIERAMGRKLLPLDDAQQLAAAFMVARATGKMHREQNEALRRDLVKLETDLGVRHRLAEELYTVAREVKDHAYCLGASDVWKLAANLVAALQQKHFAVNTMMPLEK